MNPHSQPTPPWTRTGAARHWVIGCLSATAIVLVILVIAAVYVVRHVRSIGATAVRTGIVQTIEQSDLPADQKQAIVEHVDRLAEDFNSGALTIKDLARVAEAVSESPVLPVGVLLFAQQQYIKPSALSDEEKKAASLNLQRFARGIYEKKIPTDAIGEVTRPISITGPDGESTLKSNPTTDELKEFLAAARQKADAASIPEEPFEVDIALELGKAVDDALAGL